MIKLSDMIVGQPVAFTPKKGDFRTYTIFTVKEKSNSEILLVRDTDGFQLKYNLATDKRLFEGVYCPWVEFASGRFYTHSEALRGILNQIKKESEDKRWIYLEQAVLNRNFRLVKALIGDMELNYET